MTEDNTENKEEQTDLVSRRVVLGSAVGVAAAGASGYFVGTAAADPAGEVGTATNPYLRAYVDRMVWVGRTTDPTSPDDGTVWYRSDL